MFYGTVRLLVGVCLCLISLQPARVCAKEFTLTNDQVKLTCETKGGMLFPGSMEDKNTGEVVKLGAELFSLQLTNGSFIHAADFTLAGPVQTEPLAANPGASRFAERQPGQQLTAEMLSPDGNLRVKWHGILREGSRYLRQEFIFAAEKNEVPWSGMMLLEMPLPGAHTTGTVDGCPVMTDTAFFGVEHPLSVNRGEKGYVRCFLPRRASLPAGESYSASVVAGFVPKGQSRRGFLLGYLERERAHPYRPFLHYNSWYDLGYFSKYNEQGALNVINAFGQELVVKRGVKLDSFMFDDGWDNDATLWQFDPTNFPHGFAPIRAAAAKYGAAPGIWLSPWGGYGKPHDERIKFGREQGFEIREGNFSLAGPKYYERFRSRCLDVITNYGVNQFKFDGIGESSGAGGGAQRDFDAMLKLIADLRALKADIYINQTTGTWPSPFWLLYADSIWRGGEDHSFVDGAGPERERWISYKDNDVHDEVVGRSELYPLNSLMLHGIIYAKSARGLNYDTNNILRSEIRAYFGSGTQLQEMYITPGLLTPENWDTLADAAKWSRANADTLVDTHWVGGRPADHEIYGWAAWSPRKGILTLRNPAAKAQEIAIDPAKVFELPEGAPQKYTVVSPFKDQTVNVTELRGGEETRFRLQPFEVLVIEALPNRSLDSTSR
jgi:hypothetical protein